MTAFLINIPQGGVLMNFQLCSLKPGEYRLTFTANNLRTALKKMWQAYTKRGEEIALYAYLNGEWIKLTDTSIYRSKDEKIKITNSSTILLG